MAVISDNKKIIQAARLLKKAKKAVVLTGAGISTPSGIPDFRSPQSGVWENADPMEVASISSFARKPQAFYNWIRPLLDTFNSAQPNPAHTALAQLEERGYLYAIITQNIDMLHTQAGSRQVHEVHGQMREATCMQCGKVVEAQPYMDKVVQDGQIPRCPDCGGVLKPNVILFGEMLPAEVMQAAELAARTCDVMLVAGSSLTVSPVSDLPLLALEGGARLILVNFEPTYIDRKADVVIYDDVARALPSIVEAIETIN